jgi:hypothetical protein
VAGILAGWTSKLLLGVDIEAIAWGQSFCFLSEEKPEDLTPPLRRPQI